MGATPIGSPLIGWIGQTFGARWAMLTGGTAAVCAALLCLALSKLRPSIAALHLRAIARYDGVVSLEDV
jgi:predicted MFS family arabinose efflux permease